MNNYFRQLKENRWLLGARVKTLPAAIVPVFVGTALGYSEGDFHFDRFLAAILVALSLQVATNYVNDYADSDHGTDDNRVGPKRLVSSGLATKDQVKRAAYISFLIAALAGLYLSVVVGPELIPVGILSILAGWGYTAGSKPYGYYGYGELFVFIFFGIVAVVGSYYVQSESVSLLSVLSGVVCGLMAVALMITNNLRDIDGDVLTGKKTLAVRIGEMNTRRLYYVVVGLVPAFIVIIAFSKPFVLLALVGYTLFLRPLNMVREGASKSDLIQVLVLTARAQLVCGLLFAVGLTFT